MPGIEGAAFAFDRACRAASVGYAFVGGIAVMAWGQPRATADVDAMIDLTPDRIDALASNLRREGFEFDVRDLQDAFHDRSHVTLHHPASAFHIDLKLAITDEEREEIRSARIVALGGHRVVVPRPEEVVAFKILYGTPQDLQDARSILIRQAGLIDVERMRGIAKRLGVLDALVEIMDEV